METGLPPAPSGPEPCCAMRNAWLTLTCIRGRVAVVVHGPNGCGADLSLPDRDPGDGAYACATDLGEIDVIMGGETALARKISAVARRVRPELIVVLGTCVSEIVGDDARAVCAQAAARLRVPVVFLPTSGLVEKGSGDASIDAVRALVETVMEPAPRAARSVNLIAHPWPDYRGIREELALRLGGLGLRLQALLAGTPTLAEIAGAPRAALNAYVPDEPAQRVALLMRERFGIPCLPVPRPAGVAATSRMLKLIAEACGVPPRRAALVERWRREELRLLAREHPGLRGRSLRLAQPRPEPGLAAALAELGLKVRWGGRAGPALQTRPPGSFLMYPGMRALAAELEAELGSRFLRTYGRYCR